MHPADPSDESAVASSGCPCSFCGEPLAADSLDCPHCLSSTPPDATLPTPRATWFNGYEIEVGPHDGQPRELGRGAMGVTYRAVDTTLNCPVALKVLAADLAGQPEAQTRLLREARAAARLRHPHIAAVHRFGVCPDGHCFYAMELVEGETLEARVLRDGPLPVAYCLEVAEQVAAALLAAERYGVVHRDLKPANLMLQDRDGDQTQPWVKVIDFGLAKAAAKPGGGYAANLTQGDFLGTPGFASPEQFDANAPLDTRSDIFSLGVTLWFALTGNVVFVGESLTAIHARQLGGEIPWHQLDDARVPDPVARLFGELLSADVAHRPQTARVLVERLRTCREELAAPPAPAPPPVRRWPGIARIAAGLVIGALVAVVSYRQFHPAQASLPVAVPATVKSIAVLPFGNLSADKENAFFAKGIQNDLIALLGRVSGLKVISRASVDEYETGVSGRAKIRAVASTLGVAYLLEGSVQRADRRVRVNVELIEAASGETLWSKVYDRELVDLFAIQDELAQCISDELRVRLSPAELAAIHATPTTDLAAYDLDLRARQLLDAFSNNFQNRVMMPEAIRLLDDAVARDPAFLRGWCDLMQAHLALYWYGYDRSRVRLRQAEDALNTAVSLAPDAGETHLALAQFHYRGFLDYERARTELALARRTLPNDPLIPFLTGAIDRRQGQWRDSERNFRRALELDPRNTDIHLELATNLRFEGRYAEEKQVMRDALAIVPGSNDLRQVDGRIVLDKDADAASLHRVVWTILHQDPANGGDVAECAVECALCEENVAAGREAVAFVPATGIPLHGVASPAAWFEGWVEHFLGDEERARAAFAIARAEIGRIAQERPDLARAQSMLGQIDAFTGKTAQAIAEGKRAVELLPASRDAIEGSELLINLAIIYTAAGQTDEALSQLEEIARMPSRLSYGMLRLHPQWKALRGTPRFEALLRQFATQQGGRK